MSEFYVMRASFYVAKNKNYHMRKFGRVSTTCHRKFGKYRGCQSTRDQDGGFHACLAESCVLRVSAAQAISGASTNQFSTAFAVSYTRANIFTREKMVLNLFFFVVFV